MKTETTLGTKKDGGKPRMDLVDPDFVVDLARVLTMGSDKYDETVKVYGNNWRHGMRWGRVYAALQRHLHAFWSGEEIDAESGLPHLSHAAFGVMALHNYSRMHRSLDDRDLPWRRNRRIFVDVDEVFANWVGAVCGRAALVGSYLPEDPEWWSFMPADWFETLFPGGEEQYALFMRNDVKPLVRPDELLFEPAGYVSNRSVDVSVTRGWLEDHGFSLAPVYHVKSKREKAALLADLGADLFIDDNYETFVECNNNGVSCLLADRPHNRRFDVGQYRIPGVWSVRADGSVVRTEGEL